MKLGFVSAILPELSLEDVVAFAAAEGYACVESMCWPLGKAERAMPGCPTSTSQDSIPELISRHHASGPGGTRATSMIRIDYPTGMLCVVVCTWPIGHTCRRKLNETTIRNGEQA